MPDCRTCGAPILWAVTDAGDRMPVDAEPFEGGNIELAQLPHPMQGLRVVMVDPAAPSMLGAPRYRSHFATCPDAPTHRKDR